MIETIKMVLEGLPASVDYDLNRSRKGVSNIEKWFKPFPLPGFGWFPGTPFHPPKFFPHFYHFIVHKWGAGDVANPVNSSKFAP